MRPAAVVAVRTAEDVAAAVRFAGEHGLTVGVQATGHGADSSLAGHLLVATKGLDEVTVHPEGWARVGAGVKWRAGRSRRRRRTAWPALNGSTSDVSVVGYTTGGGVGPMARTFGLAADRVRAFDVVTGDGVMRRVTPTEHPDLFFALRGGKGAAGIVTAVEFDLVHLPTFYGGAVYFDGADAAAVIDRWRHWSAALPEQATTSFVLFQLPPMPVVPPPLAGRMTLGVRFLWTGDADEGARLLDQIRAAAPVILDDAACKPYTAIDSVHADPVDPMPVVDPAILLRRLPGRGGRAAARRRRVRVRLAADPGRGPPARRRVRPRGPAPERLRPPRGRLQPADRRHGATRPARACRTPRDCSRAGRLGHRRGLAELRPAARRRHRRRAYDEPTLARLRQIARPTTRTGVLRRAPSPGPV